MKNQPRVLSTEEVHKNPYFTVNKENILKEDGSTGDYYIVTNNPGVFVVAITSDKKILFVKLYRYMTKRTSVELPAGGTDGEDPLIAAKRELHEETGYIAKQWKHLGHVQGSNGVSDQMFDFYIATELEHTNENDQAEEGISEVLELSLSEAEALIKTGEISDIQSIGALYMAREYLL